MKRLKEKQRMMTLASMMAKVVDAIGAPAVTRLKSVVTRSDSSLIILSTFPSALHDQETLKIYILLDLKSLYCVDNLLDSELQTPNHTAKLTNFRTPKIWGLTSHLRE